MMLCLALLGGSGVTFYPSAAYGKPTTEKQQGGGNDNKPDHAKGKGKYKTTIDPSASDGGGTTDPATLPPSLDPIGDQIVMAGETLWFTVSASDPESDALVLDASNLPPGATFADNGDGTAYFAWTTGEEQAGLYSGLTFSVSDGLYTDSEIITIAVSDPPSADDPSVSIPNLTVFGAGVIEGQTGITPAHFFVALSEATALDVTVDYYTVDGTATRGEDFEFSRGTLIIPAGETERAISVPVLGDTIEEGEESFELILENASNANIAVNSALGVIEDDDATVAATLSWQSPVTNVDGSCLTDLGGYRVLGGTESGIYTRSVEVSTTSGDLLCEQTGFNATCQLPVQTCSYTLSDLMPGIWFFAVQAYDNSMNFSPYSNEAAGDLR